MEQTPEEMGAGRRAGSRKEKPSLLARAVSYLSRREYSRRELGEKLRRLGSEDDAKVDEVLDYLEEKGYLSNERFAEQFLRAKASRYGQSRLRMELRQRGLSGEEIDRAIEGLDRAIEGLAGSEEDRAWSVWEKRFSSYPEDQKEKAKQIRFLMSRGFSYAIVSRVLQRARQNI